MKNNYNSIKSIKYRDIRNLLYMVVKKEFPTDDILKEIDNIPLFICGLFVAIKEKEYRESSLFLLNQLIDIYTPEVLYNHLNSDETKSYKITSLDISLETRKEIIDYMFSLISDLKFYNAVIFSIGFYIHPEILDFLKQYKDSKNELIKKEAIYSIKFIEEKTEKYWNLKTKKRPKLFGNRALVFVISNHSLA